MEKTGWTRLKKDIQDMNYKQIKHRIPILFILTHILLILSTL